MQLELRPSVSTKSGWCWILFVGRGSGSQISWHGNALQNWASDGARTGVAPRHGTTGAVTTFCVRKKPANFVCAWLCVRVFASTPHSAQTITFEPLLAWLYVVGASWRLHQKSRKKQNCASAFSPCILSFGSVARTGLCTRRWENTSYAQITQIDAFCYLLDANAKCAVCWKTIYMDLDDKVLIACLCGFENAQYRECTIQKEEVCANCNAGRVASEGALAPELPRATRSQPESIRKVFFFSATSGAHCSAARICAQISRNQTLIWPSAPLSPSRLESPKWKSVLKVYYLQVQRQKHTHLFMLVSSIEIVQGNSHSFNHFQVLRRPGQARFQVMHTVTNMLTKMYMQIA